jgi:hypothetical protein
MPDDTVFDKPFADSDIVPPSPDEDPEAREWLYVLTSPVTVHRDKMLVLESDGEEFMPAFADRASAEAFLERLGDPASGHSVQAMHLIDLRKLAQEKSLPVLTLDGNGGVLSGFRPSPGQPSAPSGLS